MRHSAQKKQIYAVVRRDFFAAAVAWSERELAEFEAVCQPSPTVRFCAFSKHFVQALREFPTSLYADDAAGTAARFADISSRVPGRDKLVSLLEHAMQLRAVGLIGIRSACKNGSRWLQNDVRRCQLANKHLSILSELFVTIPCPNAAETHSLNHTEFYL